MEAFGNILREGEGLLIKERVDGLRSLSVGWADVNDSPREVVVREIEEEAGGTALSPLRQEQTWTHAVPV